ncbi:hypothetical protein VIC_001949 [Vibrio coralliilyticus ATCC BAA-450]|nr:hypothetical protein VIC_001949 [Vibrio coralliilyticus ATCC BAA-450]
MTWIKLIDGYNTGTDLDQLYGFGCVFVSCAVFVLTFYHPLVVF